MIEYICEKCCKNKKYVLWRFSKPNDQNSACYKCGLPLIETNLSTKEIRIIFETSDDLNFLKAMMDLKDKDIIEFNLKLSQFENQIKQSQSIKQNQNSNVVQQSNIPKCPTCQSTNIRKIGTGERMGSVIMFGIMSKKMNKTWKCNNCGHTW